MTEHQTTPKRIQLSRAKGWRKPEGAVVVARPSKWGNPWRVEKAREVGYQGTDAELHESCVAMFRNAMHARLPAVERIVAALSELRGKDLCCWCPPGLACHADVLLEAANATEA